MNNIETFLEDITGSYPKPDKEGYRVNCPFHDDHTYDLLVNDDGRYFCFTCHESGVDLVSFLMKLYDIPDYSDDENCAFYILCQYEYGGKANLTQVAPRYHIAREKLDEYYKKNLQAAQEYAKGNFYGDMEANMDYQNYTPGFVYLYSRGLEAETLECYHVVDWQRFPTHSIFIPYLCDGVCFGYEQRRIHSWHWRKTLAMPGMKKEMVHGFHPQGSWICLVTEGPLDQMMAWQYNWKQQAQASVLGSHITDKQAELLASWDCTYYVAAFDNDLAGENAYQEFVKAMQKYNKIVLRMDVGSRGLSCIAYWNFIKCVDECLQKVGLTHEAVLVKGENTW